jgi:hypothetical protein
MDEEGEVDLHTQNDKSIFDLINCNCLADHKIIHSLSLEKKA